ncbi:MAG: nucleotidyltransferase family protein [Candidatus Bipolaricaulota bacterium]|nr:nucleotidyltransferase family protein [Candidatus Bipolaricaulota bacterium]
MKAVILCAGEGERLRPLTLTTPKPLLPIGNKPLIEHTIEWLASYNIHDLFINLHHLGETIEAHLGDGGNYGAHITYSHEEELQGTAGALRAFSDLIDKPFVVVYGDILTRFDLARLETFHRAHGGIGTLVVQRTDRPHDCDIVEVDADKRLIGLHHAPGNFSHGNLGNAALYLLEPEILEFLPHHGPADFVVDLFSPALNAGKALYAYESNEELLDIGTHTRYEEAQRRYA